ncbi:hypothetical protein SUDANB95_07896 (plasmid) [Actinosynnema sp. ALI-1.44]
MNHETYSDDDLTRDVQKLLDSGWQPRPNPVFDGLCDVQLSLVYAGEDRQRYVVVITLRSDATAILLVAPARYSAYKPFEHEVLSQQVLPVAEAVRQALAISPVHGQTDQGGPARRSHALPDPADER